MCSNAVLCDIILMLGFKFTFFDDRVPEIIFESNDVWKDISEDELLEIRSLVMHFLVSTVIQRMTHAVFEVRGHVCTYTYECLCGRCLVHGGLRPWDSFPLLTPQHSVPRKFKLLNIILRPCIVSKEFDFFEGLEASSF